MRNALIVGASRGLGRALTEGLLACEDVDRVVAAGRDPERSEALRELRESRGERLQLVSMDVTDPGEVVAAASRVADLVPRLHLLVCCAGLLHEGAWLRPEKKLEDVELESLRRVFDVNAFGPLLVARHFVELLRHDERAVLANVSARVGSIGDNRLGGWYAYRASKAAQNMFTRTLAIELRRRAPNAICVALHPGTVDTDLSKPFQGSVPAERLFEPKQAADRLLGVIDALEPEQSGSFLAWDGSRIPW